MPENNTFGIQAGQAAINTGQSFLGGLLGQVFANVNDKRQLEQQEKLNRMAISSNKELAQFNYDQQMKMWEATNYGAQMEQLKKAGLNPGLLYGMKGGGGVTTNAAQAQGVGAAQAPVGGGEIMAMMNMRLQQAMTQAQIKLAESQANKNNVEATKIGGVDTQKANIEIRSLTQGIENQKAQEQLTKADARLREMQTDLTGKTFQDQVDFIAYQAQRALTDLQNAQNETYINRTTREDKIRIIQEEAIGATLKNLLTDAQTTQTQQLTEESKQKIKESASNVEVNTQKIQNLKTEIATEWSKIAQTTEGQNIEKAKLAIEKFKALMQNAYPGIESLLLEKSDYYKGVQELYDKITKGH